MDIDLDDIDQALIVALQRDGRLSYAELGELVGLSAGGARLRVLRLQERGVMEVVGVTDPKRLGYERMAMVGVSVQGDARAIADRIGSLEGVIYLVIGTGPYDLLVELIAPDSDALYALVNEGVRGVPGVLGVQTFDYHAIHTHHFTWRPRGRGAEPGSP
ncbi:MAG: Lrp/AsnC family transcriptional regulator [Schumannella sp.]|nr:Lrp/AsnC family transcriptional regulator [Microbacteriaceae bacterium]